MFEQVERLVTEHEELGRRLADPTVHGDPSLARRLGRRYAELGAVVTTYRAWQQAEGDGGAALDLVAEDPAFAAEAEGIAARRDQLAERLRRLLVPRDPSDSKDAIVEIKAGEGGAESALFAGDLLRMYLRYAERRGWRSEVLDATDSDLGGVKSVTLAVAAKGAPEPGQAPYALLKHEAGVHRVQRVPVTESQGRIHTSAAGVLVLPEAEPVDVELSESDLRVDVFRSSGPGGQSVNTTDSAVRITHLPTGIVVSCQNEKSQLQNKAAALRVLQSRLLERVRHEREEQMNALKGDGGNSWGSQMRSYVLHPYQMVKDLRTEYETSSPDAVFDGDIDGFIESGIRWRRTSDVASA